AVRATARTRGARVRRRRLTRRRRLRSRVWIFAIPRLRTDSHTSPSSPAQHGASDVTSPKASLGGLSWLRERRADERVRRRAGAHRAQGRSLSRSGWPAWAQWRERRLKGRSYSRVWWWKAR